MMVMHQAPTDGGNYEGVAHFHVEFYSMNRTREKLKYLAGSETGAGAFIVDVMPEAMAAQLRAASSMRGISLRRNSKLRVDRLILIPQSKEVAVRILE
jgi:galactose-1-phosphate uridylyltransferase